MLVAVAALAACGDSTSTTPEIVDPDGPPFGIKVTARDLAFDPAEWTVPSSAVLVVDFENLGAVEHWFVVVAEGRVDSAADLDPSNIHLELRAPAGELVSSTFRAPGLPGEYQVICKVPGHLEAGMEGVLIVER